MGTIVATPDASRRLGDFSLLEELNEQEKRGIEQRCHKRTYSRNETILDKGSQSREVFFVLKGSVSVITFSPAGREVTLAAVKAGEGTIGSLRFGSRSRRPDPWSTREVSSAPSTPRSC